MAYFVTGATGFIGSRLVERLLEKRQGKVYVLVRESSRPRLDDLIEPWSIVAGSSAAERVIPVYGDLRSLLPEWVPLVGIDLGHTNVVPVDWVAGALEHIAHESGLDGHAFHLTDPRPQRVDELINELAAAAHAPRF